MGWHLGGQIAVLGASGTGSRQAGVWVYMTRPWLAGSSDRVNQGSGGAGRRELGAVMEVLGVGSEWLCLTSLHSCTLCETLSIVVSAGREKLAQKESAAASH